jgi:hypothetical protein
VITEGWQRLPQQELAAHSRDGWLIGKHLMTDARRHKGQHHPQSPDDTNIHVFT